MTAGADIPSDISEEFDLTATSFGEERGGGVLARGGASVDPVVTAPAVVLTLVLVVVVVLAVLVMVEAAGVTVVVTD